MHRPVQYDLESLGQHCTRVLDVQYCPKRIKTTLTDCFLLQCCLEPQGQHYIGIFLRNVAQGVLRQHYTGFFSLQYCLEPF